MLTDRKGLSMCHVINVYANRILKVLTVTVQSNAAGLLLLSAVQLGDELAAGSEMR